jgi:hypothetical protein
MTAVGLTTLTSLIVLTSIKPDMYLPALEHTLGISSVPGFTAVEREKNCYEVLLVRRLPPNNSLE